MVKITKNGIYNDNEKVIDLSYYLTESVELENVTLENLFDILNEFPNIDELFSSWTRGFKFQPYYNELKENNTDDSEFTRINFQWFPEVYEYENDDCEIESEFTEYVGVTAISLNTNDNYSLSLIPLNQFKDCLLVIDKKYVVKKNITDTILVSEKEIDLFNFIGSLLYEISFHGYSEDKKEVMEDLNDISERIDMGEEEFIDSDELFIKWLEEDLERLVANEKYEKAEKVKKKIEEYKNKKEE